MFKKFSGLTKGLGKGGKGQRYKIEVQVVQVEGLPDAVKKARVVMSRSSKVSMTDVKDTRNGKESDGPCMDTCSMRVSRYPCMA